MTLRQFVESFCADTAEVHVYIVPTTGAGISVELPLGRGVGGSRSRPALERYSSAGLAELICICPAARPGEIELLAETDWKNITLLASQILGGELEGSIN